MYTSRFRTARIKSSVVQINIPIIIVQIVSDSTLNPQSQHKLADLIQPFVELFFKTSFFRRHHLPLLY